MSEGPAPFDVAGPLPCGTTVLEASAGTGKTYTIAALAARYVAEGVAALPELMLVTFGRMATNELRLRVRERLVAVEARLSAVLAGRTSPAPGTAELDAVERLLTTGALPELERRRERVARALADFDAATIATTHEFCLQMLDGLGVLGDREPEARFVDQVSELTREAATDVYLRRYATSGTAPFAVEEALAVAESAVHAVHARLVPTQSLEEGSPATERTAYAEQVRQEVDRRKRSGRLFTYDDMLTRLRDALADPELGAAAAGRLRERYQIVLVDEFQDTDPVQWEILRRAFHGSATLILIGDPKQAIYAFRGADVQSYLEAVREADHVQTLTTNWRSDSALVDALHALIGGAALGEEQIVVRPVTADHRERRLDCPDPDLAAPLRLRVLPYDGDSGRVPPVAAVRPQIQADLVADITALLASGAELQLPVGRRPVQPHDVAVLVRRNERGEALRDALVQAGVPAVMYGASSVFASPVARDWLTLLTALEQPRQQLVRQAALTCFFGWSFEELANASEDALTALSLRVRWWSKVLAFRGVAALLETATADEQVPERLLGIVGGERLLTDLRHLGQNLHAAMTGQQLGVSALVQWLSEQMAEARHLSVGDGSRRLETDAQAVTVLTVHRSKGLEFPIVYLPELWDRHVNGKDNGEILRLHDVAGPAPEPGLNGSCVLDVGGRWSPGRPDRFARHRAEDAGEDLRLGYVALTRAQCQVVTWWAPSRNTPASALQRFLHRPRQDGAAPDPAYALGGDPLSEDPLDAPAGTVRTEEVVDRLPVPWRPAAEVPPRLVARRFDRLLDVAWRRTSYSALTAAVHGVEAPPAVGSEPEPVHDEDEPAAEPTPPVRSAGGVREGWDMPSPMRDLPSGAAFGTAVHTVFESVDTAAPDLAAALRQACATTLATAPATELSADDLAAALLPSLLTPLGPLADDRRLADIPRRDQLAELGFEFPLAGGEVTTAELALGALVPLLRRHLPPHDPLVGYAALLEHPALGGQTLRGYLNGSIDAVLRLRDGDGKPRYVVVDYKTNWLGRLDTPVLTVGDYAPSRLAEAMLQAHYPLQALLYSVALHRMLRWRQPGYDPARHLGGVLYLFVRGMAGPDTPRVDGVPCGVFSWRPAPELVVELSALLDGVVS